jgi:hypothetical protein
MDKQLITRESVVAKVEELLELPTLSFDDRKELDFLKATYFKFRRADTNPVDDFLHNHMMELLTSYKKRKAQAVKQDEDSREANYELCLQIIDQLKALIDSQDDFNQRREAFKALNLRWKSARPLPPTKELTLLRAFQKCNEDFYDLLKINAELRDYDFKKNLETKLALCEAVEALVDDTSNIPAASKKLQDLQNQWRDTGPVDKEHRIQIWDRFRITSATVHRLHQSFFEERKLLEKTRISLKLSLCEAVEAIDTTSLHSAKDWELKTQEITDAREEWKNSGTVDPKIGARLFARFRAAGDEFFDKRHEFFKEFKKIDELNVAKRRDLCEQAEALKDSIENFKDSADWRTAADKCIALRNEWKSTPSPRRRHTADALWHRFDTAIDTFFERRDEALQQQREAALTLRAIAKPRDTDPRTELTRRRDRLKDELLTYQTNLSRFTSSSKKPSPILEEIQKTITRLQNDLASTQAKLSTLNNPSPTSPNADPS